MSNDLTALITKILATGLKGLRSQVLMTRLVNLDYSAEAAKKGSTVDIPVSQTQTTSDVVPSNTSPAPADTAPKVVQISLDYWKKTNFGLTDDDLNKINANKDFIPLQMGEAFQALASTINQTVFSKYKGVYGFTGTPGTTPFASDVTAATNARKILNSQRAPKGARRAILDFDAEANALALAPFSDAEKVGSSGVKIEGEIGRKYGIDWYSDEDVPTHTAGTCSDGVVAADTNAGASAVTISSTAGGTYLQGDVVTFAGHTQTYSVSADVTIGAGGSASVGISPDLADDVAASTAVTIKGDHVVNLAFHRDAFALAMRAPDAGLKEVYNPANSVTLADPVSGLVMRLELVRQYKQVMWELDAMWGCALVRAAKATRIAG